MTAAPRGPLRAGERVLLVDSKKRRHLVVLSDGGEFHTHAGVLAHDDLIGRDDGALVRTARGARLTAVRPTLGEYVLEMPRGAQVIYPKDLGPILVLGDVFPGAHVLESGLGSGALTTALLRAIGPTGRVTGYEIRDDFAKRAAANVEGFLGEDVPLVVEVRDVYAGIDETGLDRVFLDLPEPWRVVSHAAGSSPPRRDHSLVPTDDPAGGEALRGARRLCVRHGRDGRGAAAGVARRWSVGAPRSPDGRPHGLPHRGSAPRRRRRVNLLDVGVIVAATAAGIGGWRLGLVARVLGWTGVVAGLAIGIQLVPRVVTWLGGESADDRVTVALVFLVLVASIGQGVGLAVGMVLPRLRPPTPRFESADRAGGAVVGVVGVLALVWMVIPSLATAQGWPARAARGSFVIDALDAFAPAPPGRFAAWGRAISEAPYPAALGTLEEPPDPGTPPVTGVPPEVDRAVRASVVKVTGSACSQIQEGSGWVAAPSLVVTNAHVVAGEAATEVVDDSGAVHDATVVAFDAVRDLAVLSVPGLTAPAIPLGPGEEGDLGAFYGHPGGDDLRAAPARIGEEITAVGTDIYRTAESRRQVFVVAAELHPGDSGGPLVDGSGTVVAVAFAIDPGDPGTAYALTDAEVRVVLDTTGDAPVSTGACLVG